jgi:hypothetical protein
LGSIQSIIITIINTFGLWRPNSIEETSWQLKSSEERLENHGRHQADQVLKKQTDRSTANQSQFVKNYSVLIGCHGFFRLAI